MSHPPFCVILRLRAAVKNSPETAYVRQRDFPAVWVPPRGMDTQNDNVVGVRRPDTFALTDHSGRHIRVDAITNQLQSDKVLRRAKCGVSADFPGGRALCPSVILSPQAKDLGPASRQ